MRTRRNLVTGVAAAALALTACGIAASKFRRDAGRASGCGISAACPAATGVTDQGELAQVKRHIMWGRGSRRAQRPQAAPGHRSGDLAKVKRDVGDCRDPGQQRPQRTAR